MDAHERLERLRNRLTRYELVATSPDGKRRVLIAYSHRRSRDAMWRAITGREERRLAVIQLVGGEQQAQRVNRAKRAADGATIGGWQFRFTNRTQREAITSGELPYVEDSAPLGAALGGSVGAA